MAQPLGVEYGQKMTLTGPDGTVAVFNDTSDPNFVGSLDPANSSGLDSPDVRENADDLVQMDGGVHGDFFYGRRPLTLGGRVHGHTSTTQRNLRLDLLKRATNALRPVALGSGPAAAQGNSRLSWTPSGGVPVFIDVRRQQPLRVTAGWVKEFQAQMVAADPRFYSQTLHSSTTAGLAASGSAGVSFNVQFGINFPSATPAASLSLLNDGSTTTNPTFYINGPCTNPAVYNATTGKSITFAYTLAANEGLVVDTQNRLVYYGTRTNITNLATSPSSEGGTKAFNSGPNWPTTAVATGTGGVTSFVGSNHLQHAWSGVTTDTNMGAVVWSGTLPSAGTYVVSSWVYIPSAYTGSAFSIGTDASFVGSAQTATVAADLTKRDQWQRIYSTVNIVAGDLAGTFVLRHGAYPAAAGTGIVYSDAAQIEVLGSGSTPSRYGDGSFSGWTWSGAANASTSSGPGSEVTATTNSRYGAVDFGNTQWDGLVPGTNDVRFIPFSWSAGAGLRVDWRDAWL